MHRSTILRIALTVITGSLTGASFVLTKLLLGMGADRIAVSFIQLAGAGSLLLSVLRLRGAAPRADTGVLRYFLIASLIALAAGPLLGTWVLGRIPAAIFTVVVTFSPMFTTLFSALIERRPPAPSALAGVMLGLAGVLLVLLPRIHAAPDGEALALGLALGIPMLLALGNVYRSRYWPAGLAPAAASAGSMASQGLLLIPILATEPHVGSTTLLHAAPLLGLLVLVTLSSNLAGSTLQRVAGATAYSQIGYVIALTGVAAGTLVFHETLAPVFWPALVLVFAGIVLNNRARSSSRAASSSPSLTSPSLTSPALTSLPSRSSP
jgi:drug/metabolite transporter (DMT)-like permease